MTTIIYEDKDGRVKSRYIGDGKEYIVFVSPYGSLRVITPRIKTIFDVKRAIFELKMLKRR